uniref:Uncharacterized protein n=1 Tax=Podoviridae sp. ctJDl18 TaxID=2825242 RepID=A0A8S5V0V8_9CAUD|nr:MAG TPA: hypothetical protein [Podoviridae sp. ctJDl18]DAM57802.1 MAG TPA: hypothetical protein [Caudoviricetes sp.]
MVKAIRSLMLNNNFKCSHSNFLFKAISKQTL